MLIESHRNGETLTVKAEGQIDILGAPKFEKAVKGDLEGVKELIIDLAGAEYVSSAGLRVILTAAKLMKKQGTIKVIHVPPSVMDVFRFTGMTKILDIRQV